MVEREDVDSSSDDEEGLPNGWERRVVRGGAYTLITCTCTVITCTCTCNRVYVCANSLLLVDLVRASFKIIN